MKHRQVRVFTVEGIDIPPIGLPGAPGDTVIWPTDTADALRAVSTGAPNESIRCDALDPDIATVEARLCGPAGESPGAWTEISTGAGLATGAATGDEVFFQVRCLFTDRDDDEIYRLFASIFVTEDAHANGA
jgi:hypothetical protein